MFHSHCVFCDNCRVFSQQPECQFFATEIALDCWPLHWPILPWHTELASGPSACQRSTQCLRAWTSSPPGKFYSSREIPVFHLCTCVEPSLITEKWIQPSLQQLLLHIHLPRGSWSQLCLPVFLKMSHVSQSNRLFSGRLKLPEETSGREGTAKMN